MIRLSFLKFKEFEYNNLIAYYDSDLNKVILFDNILNDFEAIFEFYVFFYVLN